MIKKTEIKRELEKKLNRLATENEISNATKDVNILVEILMKTIEDHESRITLLEKK